MDGIFKIILNFFNIIIQRQHSSKIPVILYHSVSNDFVDKKISMDTKTFKKQMSIIKILGYKPITIDEYEQIRLKNGYSKGLKILITFDDGYEDFFLYAYPILLIHKFPAVVFLPTGFIGKKAKWLDKYSYLYEKKLLTWRQIQEIQNNRISFCSHTATHSNLKSLDRNALVFELSDSKAILKEKLGKEVNALSYPFSLHNGSVTNAARECGYDIGFAVDTGDETNLSINRIECFQTDSIFRFILKISGFYNLLIKIRSWLIDRCYM